MQQSSRQLPLLLTLFIGIGTLTGLVAAYKQFHIEQRNRKVEIALEWPEIVSLSQTTQAPVSEILRQFKIVHVTSIAIPEDTPSALELTGAVSPHAIRFEDGQNGIQVQVASSELMARVRLALTARNITTASRAGEFAPPYHETQFVYRRYSAARGPDETAAPGAGDVDSVFVPLDYPTLRTLGLGLPADAVTAAEAAGLHIAARISNFPGVSDASATAVLRNLRKQSRNVSTVIFLGDDVLGYRGLEKRVADLLRLETPASSKSDPNPLSPVGLVYGAVEFGKQRGDEKLSAALHGDFVRVHSIQSAEMATMEDDEAIDRYVKAVRERNIRFCYVRLLTFAGNDPIGENEHFLQSISRGMAHGSALTGGDLGFGPAKRYDNTGVTAAYFVLLSLGVAAGVVWMVGLIYPMPSPAAASLLAVGLAVCCVGAVLKLDETGRKLVALLAGIAFPTAACLITWPQTKAGRNVAAAEESPAAQRRPNVAPDFVKAGSTRLAAQPLSTAPVRDCLAIAVRAITVATAITFIGIIHVTGLLATRPFMLHASQFLGIKAQHAVPLLLIATVALMGGVMMPGELRKRFKARARTNIAAAMSEPTRVGILLVSILALAIVALIVARTGNDAGVGVSSFELKGRAILDRIMPVRPRTKEFLLGHPLFILGIAWWFRGRKRIAIPCFVFGSLGQASLLNTFCHIHTPLIVSLWRGLTGLVLGTLIGAAIFIIVEKLAPPGAEEPL